MKKKKRTRTKKSCHRIRVLYNGVMMAGFLLLCVGMSHGSPVPGVALLFLGFLGKLVRWRCPACGAHLMLCVRGGVKECPYCGTSL